MLKFSHVLDMIYHRIKVYDTNVFLTKKTSRHKILIEGELHNAYRSFIVLNWYYKWSKIIRLKLLLCCHVVLQTMNAWHFVLKNNIHDFYTTCRMVFMELYIMPIKRLINKTKLWYFFYDEWVTWKKNNWSIILITKYRLK